MREIYKTPIGTAAYTRYKPSTAVFRFILNKNSPPKAVPTANTVIRLIAKLGGFLGRKGDGEPGAKTLWLGMRDLAVFVQSMRYARELQLAG